MDIFLTPEAEKQLKKLPINEQTRINKKIQILKYDQFSGKKLSGQLKDLRSLRSWPYRIIYFLDNKNNCWIVSILHRQGAYK